MVIGEGSSYNKSTLFDGTNDAFWRLRMQTYLYALGFDIQEVMESRYIAPSTPPTNAIGKKICENESKAMNAIMYGLFIASQ